jgi:hypothetical protein
MTHSLFRMSVLRMGEGQHEQSALWTSVIVYFFRFID